MIHGTHNALEDSRNEHILISINDELFPRNEARISVFDAGYLVGDGVWEGLRLHQGRLVFWDDHMDRLYAGAKTIGLDIGYKREDVLKSGQHVLNANNMVDGVHVRIMITRGIKKTPSQDPRLTISGPNIVIIAEHKEADPTSTKNGITLFTSTLRRGSPDSLDPRLNCHSKIHEVQALIQALEAGADEALMLDIHGFVSTCNATNFFIVKGQEVWTSTGNYCMMGITRSKVIDICRTNNITCKEKNFSLFDVYSADEAFVTGSFGGLTPVTKIDGRIISEHIPMPITKQLQQLYKARIKSEMS